jgi:hypothetical protein
LWRNTPTIPVLLLELCRILGYKKELLASTFFLNHGLLHHQKQPINQFTKSPSPPYYKMQLISLVGLMALVPAVLSSPTDYNSIAARADKRGTEIIAGLGSRKQEVVSAGGNTRDLAIAMLETLVHLLSDFDIVQISDRK